MNARIGVAFLTAVFLAVGCSEEPKELTPIQKAVREHVAAEKARVAALTPEERAAEDQRKADVKAAAAAAAEAEKQVQREEQAKRREELAKKREEQAKFAEQEKRYGPALGICRIAMERSLHDPDTAKLESTYKWHVEERKDGTVLVQPTGRAKNAFGAYIYGVWNCVVKFEGEDVVVQSLKQIRP